MDIPDLTGRNVVITGANSGLGLQTAKVLSGAGATVYMTAREPAKHDAAEAELRAQNPSADVHFIELDLADLSSVERAAKDLAGRMDHIDILVNNAGVMLTPDLQTTDGLELQIGTNHFGHYAFTGRLLPQLLAAPEARVVNVSSLAHRLGAIDFDDLHQRSRPYDTTFAYGQSKLANLVFMRGLQRFFEQVGSSARSVAAHPGYTATNLQSAGARLEGRTMIHRVSDVLSNTIGNTVFAMKVEHGAKPQIHAATADVPGGSYWGPRGLMETRGKKVAEASMSPKAVDDATADHLWQVSEETTGVRYSA